MPTLEKEGIVEEISGVLIVDKPAGITSHDVVSRIRRLYHTKKVGHTGTLDPMATGVLPILIGRAAKAAEYVAAEEKQYRAVLQLGMTTDTEDITGTVLTKSESFPTAADVAVILPQFLGKIAQIPPMYSALKRDGVKLVDLARQGIEIPREAREITVSSLMAEPLCEAAGRYRLEVTCSKGTYIRTLCADMGAALGCGGVMADLRRCRSGHFSETAAYTLEALEEMNDTARRACLMPTESLFADCEAVCLPPFFAHLGHSGALLWQYKLGTTFPIGTRVRLLDKDGFFALGEVVAAEDSTAIKPIKQFVL